MSSVDNRIVNMEFNNAAFERGAATTMSTLDRLSAKLKLDGASAGLSAIEAQAGKFDLSHMGAAVDQIASRFSTLGVVAVTALATITNKAIETGTQLVKSLTVGPIGEGFSDYNLKLTSIKTVMNTTGKSLQYVNGYFDQLDEYADKTIFKLSDMTGAFAKFTNAGVSIKKAVPAIKGISNMVALAGQGADAASIAYYNLSQSISGGFLTTTDYKSLNLANVATKEWKQNIIDAAVEAGTLRKTGKDMYVTLSGESEKAFKGADLFNQGLSEQWANADILLDVLGKYGDATTEIGKKAQGAAQDVKSLPMMLDTLKAAVGTSWTQTFETMFGNVEQSTELFTNLTNTIQGVLDKSNDARNQLLGDWAKLGGRADLIDSIKNIFAALGDVLGPIHDAFRDIFPAMTGKRLAELTANLKTFTEGLRLGDDTMENLKRTFRGVFAVFDILGQVISGAIGVIADLFGTVGDGSGSFLEVTASIGDWLVKLDEAIKSGEGLTEFFDGLSAVLRVPIRLIQALAGFIADLFTGVDTAGGNQMVDTLSELGDKLSPLELLGKRVNQIFESFGNTFKRVSDIIEPLASFIGDAISNIADAIANAFDGNSFDSTLDAINTGLFAGLVLLFRKFVNGGLTGLLGSGKGGLLGTISGAFKGLTNTLSAMQANLKADTLMKIAIAIGLLTISIVALSLIDSDKLTKAMTAIAVGFGELVGAMAILEQVSSSTGFLKMPFITASLIALGAAMVLLAAAAKIFSTMDWNELAKGLTGVAGTLIAVAAGMRAMPKGMLLQAVALNVLAVALAALAGAVKLFSELDYSEIGRGLVGIGGALVVIAAGMALMPPTLPITAAGLVLVGIGLAAVAGAVQLMSGLSWKEMGKGLVGVAGALIIIAGAMNLMPLTLPITAAGLVLVSGALVVLAGALKLMGTMSWEEIGKGLATLAGSLIILAAGLYAMSGTLAGAAALVVAAGALAILTPVLVTLGSLSWESIAKGLTALAGSFAVLGIAGLLLGPIIPAILGLAGALALTGAGMALAGAGALAFATAFAIITATGAAGVAVLAAMLNVVIDAIPAMLGALAQGIIQFAKVIQTGGPEITKAFVVVLDSLLDAIIKITPKVGRAITTLIHTFLQVIQDNFGNITEAGFQMLMHVLRGIRDHISEIVTVVSKIIQKFMKALGDQLPDLLQAGADLIVKFLEGLAKTINDNDDKMIDAGYDVAQAIIEGMLKGLAEGPKRIAEGAWKLGKAAIGGLMDSVDANSPSKEAEKVGKYVTQGFVKGLDGGEQDVLDSFARMKDLIINQFEASKAEIEANEAKLDELRKHPAKNADEIAKVEKALTQAKILHERAAAARKVFNKDLKDEQKELRGLAREHDRLTDELIDAKDKLQQAIDERDNLAKSTTEKFGALPDIDGSSESFSTYSNKVVTAEKDLAKFNQTLNDLRKKGLSDEAYTNLLKEGVGAQAFIDGIKKDGTKAIAELNTLATEFNARKTPKTDAYVSDLQKQTDEVNKFHDSLNTLVGMGLDDASLQKFLDEGTPIQPFIDELIAQGPAAVTQINTLTTNLGNAAKSLGDMAATELKQAGVDMAQQLVDGLKNGIDGELDVLEEAMRKIGRRMVRALKKELKIKSPSQVMMEIGKLSNEGLAKGLDKYAYKVDSSAANVANTAIDSIRSTLKGMADHVATEVNTSPTISPVLDLTQVTKDAAKMSDMMDKAAMAEASYGSAMTISDQTLARLQEAQDASTAVPPSTTKVELTQNNYSPKALSNVEIYRQTRNLVSLAEEALSNNAAN